MSQAYPSDLAVRYGDSVTRQPSLVLPFPGDPSEFDLEAPIAVQTATWRYVGRGGPDMQLAANAFFFAWAQWRRTQPGAEPHRFEALGTSYAPKGKGQKTIEPLASAHGLAALCSESPDRLGYREMLATLHCSGALVVFGSDDPAYTASKIYPYLLSGRPLLAIFHEQSSVVDLMQTVGGGMCVTFNSHDDVETLGARIFERWFANATWHHCVKLDIERFEPFTAHAQARQLGAWFTQVIAAHLEKSGPHEEVYR